MQPTSTVATDARLRRIMAGVHANHYIDVAELATMPKPGFLIDGVLTENGLSVLYGPPKIGKSFMALDWALHMATGRDWQGLETRKGRVMYLLGEGIGGAGARLRAWSQYYKQPLEKEVGIESSWTDPDGVFHPEQPIMASVPLYFPTKMVNFFNPDSAFAFLGELSYLFSNGIDLLVIDTLARAMAGGDENKVGDVSQVVAIADYIRQETKAAVLFVHHSRKEDNVERGSSALRGAVDCMLRMTEKGSLVVDYARDFESGGSFGPFVFEKVGESGVLHPTEKAVWGGPVGSQTDTREKILTALYQDGPLTLKALAELAGFNSSPAALYHVRKLAAEGLVEKEGGEYKLVD